MKRFLLSILAMAMCASAAHATSPPEPKVEKKDACAFISRLGGVRALDSRTAVILSSTGKPAYLVTLSMPLPDLKFATRYAYIDRDGDGQLCGRSMDAIAIPDDAIRVPARISAMTPLDAQSIQALEEQYGVTLTRKSKRKDSAAAQSEAPEA
jgi:hypothetical protein